MKIELDNGAKYYVNDKLIINLNIIKKRVKDDLDFVFIIDGPEGSGKSVLAMQLAGYLDPSIDLERITFMPDDFCNQVLKAKRYQAVVFDEAYGGLSSRSAMSMVNRTIVRMMAEIRQKNLFLFIVLPTFFDLDKNIALWRGKVLIHTYFNHDFKRGQYLVFDYNKKQYLYLKGKPTYNYGVTRSNFFAKFSGTYAVDEKKYRRKKNDSLKRYIDLGDKPRTTYKGDLKISHAMKTLTKMGHTQRQIADIFNVSHSSVGNVLREKPNGHGHGQ